MFNNANVIFRTKFVDGSSTVSRTVNAGAVALLKAKDKVVLDRICDPMFLIRFICYLSHEGPSSSSGRELASERMRGRERCAEEARQASCCGLETRRGRGGRLSYIALFFL